MLTATLRVVPIDDTAYEGTEGVTLSVLSGVGYVLGNPTSVSGTIADNDTAPSTATVNLTATDAAGAEPGTNTIRFTLTRTGVLTSQISVGLGWSGTATYGKDYKVTVTGGVLNAKGTAVTLLASATTATITVTPLDDTRIEPAETVVLTLKAGTGYTLGADRAATGTIADDDGAAASATTALTAASAPSSDDTAPVATTPAVAPEASPSLVSPAVALTAVDGGTTVALDTTTTSGESSAPAPDGELETEPAGRPPGRKD